MKFGRHIGWGVGSSDSQNPGMGINLNSSPTPTGAGSMNKKGAVKMKTFITMICAMALVAAFATTAYGQSSIDGYNDQAGQIQSFVDKGGSGGGGGGVAGVSSTPATTTTTADPVAEVAATTTTADSGGSLPFTGLDVALLAAAGGLLAAAGLGMRRLTRAPDAA
jgi:hypothetical protein